MDKDLHMGRTHSRLRVDCLSYIIEIDNALSLIRFMSLSSNAKCKLKEVELCITKLLNLI